MNTMNVFYEPRLSYGITSLYYNGALVVKQKLSHMTLHIH